MLMDAKEHFSKLLRPLFPKDASFNHDPRFTGGLLYRVDWRIPEEGRPNKHSRPIEVVVSDALVDDHYDAPMHVRAVMEQRIVKWINAQIAQFDPRHQYRPEQVVPAVRWIVSTAMVNP